MQTLIILGVYSTYLHFKSILNFQRTKLFLFCHLPPNPHYTRLAL
jgi:hypothetical protein